MFNELVTWPAHVKYVVQQFYELGGLPMVCGCIDRTSKKIDDSAKTKKLLSTDMVIILSIA